MSSQKGFHAALFSICCTLAASTAQAALTHYYPLNGNGNANIGSPNGTLINGAAAAIDRHNLAGGAVSFNGVNQSVNIGAAGLDPLDGDGTFSFSFWANWQGTQDAACCGGTFGNVHSRQVNGIASENIVGLNTNNPATGRVTFQQGAGAPIITGTTIVGDNVWRNVVLTVSPGTGTRLYVDGVLQGSAAAITNASHANWPLSLGAWTGDGNGFSTSRMDDYGITSQALTDAEVMAIYSGSANSALRYNLDDVNALIDLHASAGAGQVPLGALSWEYATGLTTPLGQFAQGPGGRFFLRLTAAGTGVQQVVPEPASIVLWAMFALGAIAWWRRRKTA